MLAVDSVLHPRRAIGFAAAKPDAAGGAVRVAVTAAIFGGVLLIATAVGGVTTAGVVASLVSVPLLFGFWLLDAWLIDSVAPTMGLQRQRRRLLATTAVIFPVLLGYALVGLAQTAALRLGAQTVSDVVGWLALADVLWFIVLEVMAITAVYEAPGLPAVALALLPYAVIMTVLLVLIVVLSAVSTL